jgi:hypothetical protein
MVTDLFIHLETVVSRNSLTRPKTGFFYYQAAAPLDLRAQPAAAPAVGRSFVGILHLLRKLRNRLFR